MAFCRKCSRFKWDMMTRSNRILRVSSENKKPKIYVDGNCYGKEFIEPFSDLIK